MEKELLTVGIDIGTTTTQVVFSRIRIQNVSAACLAPKVEIVAKDVCYKSRIYFTPTVSPESLDIEGIRDLLEKEYRAAGVAKSAVTTGAIIVTGESARKENAAQVATALADFAGDFVAVAAGTDLESLLAGRGSGAAARSLARSETMVNFDIGGGTTNVAVFNSGRETDLFGMHIGGRLVRIDADGNITYVSEKIHHYLAGLNLEIVQGAQASMPALTALATGLAMVLYKVMYDRPLSDYEKSLFIDHDNQPIGGAQFSFSGGVSEYVYSDYCSNTLPDVAKYGDIGPLLGQAVRSVFGIEREKNYQPEEKIRATVIGAGSCSLQLSGSTVVYDNTILPKKNLPIVSLFDGGDEDYTNLAQRMASKAALYQDAEVAFYFNGPPAPSYFQVRLIAEQIRDFYRSRIQDVVILVKEDFAKALGQTLHLLQQRRGHVICIDSVDVAHCDYIDIGQAIADVVPVIVKTLIFRN